MLYQKYRIYWIAQLLFLSAVFFKQFYIFPSGGMQIGDILFAFSFVMLFLSGRMKKKCFIKNNFPYVLFLISICFINFLYFIAYGSTTFIISSIYYIYNCIVMCTFYQYMDHESFFKGVMITVKIVLLTQLLIRVANIGRWYMGDRYMGTFNDPNQFAFYIFAAVLILSVIELKFKEKINYTWILIAVFLIFESASMGALLGISILCMGDIVFSTKSKRILVFKILIFFFVCMMIAIEFAGQLPEFITSSEAYVRLIQKINKYELGVNVNIYESLSIILEERGWYRITDYPEKILYGAGEGLLGRFDSTMEIHSSFFNILFYYGFFPTCCFCVWILKKFNKINKLYRVIYVSLFIEALFLNNTRQPFFWMLLILMEIDRVYKYDVEELN